MISPSLINYLSGNQAPFYLDILSESGITSEASVPQVPVDYINDTSLFSRIISARLLSDAGKLVKNVFLLVSRDDYLTLEGGFSPLTNIDIESAWQDTFSFHLKKDLLIELMAQKDDKAGFAAFKPIFLCTKLKRFFHPLCPNCSSELDVCRDDDLLEKSGLKPYSRSLKRYLSCPVCSNKGNGYYYAYAPDSVDPACVKGPAELIISLKDITSPKIPCSGCKEHQACYQDGNILSVISAVAFYPFYLLLFDAASLNAMDFLALLSGASFEDLEQSLTVQRLLGRKNLVMRIKNIYKAPLMFQEDERSFLEILYLKISFLGEVARHILSDEDPKALPEFSASLDRLWVHIPEQSRDMPAFWTFRLSFFDIGTGFTQGQIPSGISSARSLGIIWFHALLYNRSQGIKSINEGIRQILKEKTLNINSELFMPENIFWDSKQAAGIEGVGKTLWEKALALGKDLLVCKGKEDFSEDEFWNTFNVLRVETKKALFYHGESERQGESVRAMPEIKPENNPDDEKIGIIIDHIKSKWEQKPTEIKPVAVTEEEDFSTETIIVDRKQVFDAMQTKDMDQTVLMHTSTLKQEVKEQEKVAINEKSIEDNLDETIVITKPLQGAPITKEQRHAQTDEELSETIILKPEKK